jgi:ppGpp synthetase/RelA/SpoT-type nucleotidyltranferase
MTETELRERYRADLPMPKAMGNYVYETLAGRLQSVDGEFGDLLKIPVKPRVKEMKSLLGKVLRKKKGYDEITDKVGLRYVVLLDGDIRAICEQIEEESSWRASRDRDYEDERREKPSVFEYQSVHYVVRLCQTVAYQGQDIAARTPCEIQVRTLLQHAVAELTHDAVYKSPVTVEDPDIHRTIAKSTALIEATGDFFTKAANKLTEVKNDLSGFNDILTAAYGGVDPDTYLDGYNTYLIDGLRGLTGGFSKDSLERFLEEKSYLRESIERHKGESALFSQPAVLLLYYLVNEQKDRILPKLPLPLEDLAPIYSDLGIAMDPS